MQLPELPEFKAMTPEKQEETIRAIIADSREGLVHIRALFDNIEQGIEKVENSIGNEDPVAVYGGSVFGRKLVGEMGGAVAITGLKAFVHHPNGGPDRLIDAIVAMVTPGN